MEHTHGEQDDDQDVSDRDLLELIVSQNAQMLDHQHLIMDGLTGLGDQMTQGITELDTAEAGLAAAIQTLADGIGVQVTNLQAALDKQTAAYATLQATDATDVAARDAALASLATANADAATVAAELAALQAKVAGITITPPPPPPPPPPPVARTLYVHVNAAAGFDTGQWLDSGLKTVAGESLYTFSGDVNPGDATGVGPDWAVGVAAPPVATVGQPAPADGGTGAVSTPPVGGGGSAVPPPAPTPTQ